MIPYLLSQWEYLGLVFNKKKAQEQMGSADKD